jgi:hypothetical protein
MSRIDDSNPEIPTYRAGMNGHIYVYCRNRDLLTPICTAIGKSPNTVYYNSRHNVWVIRAAAPQHKQALRDYFGK